LFKVTQFEPKALRWWFSQRTKIDMNPTYQRHGRIWSVTDKAFLIDSVLNEYDVPKIYMADFTFGYSSLNKKSLPYAIIDGKQRLEALFDFFLGRLVLDQQFVLQQDTSLALAGKDYSHLRKNHPEIADIFDNYALSVMRVVTDDEEKINELFVRLNRSKPLTGAEIRNAMSGPVPALSRALADHELFMTCVTFPRRRAQDKNAATKLLLFEYSEGPQETKRRNLDKFAAAARKESASHIELAARRVVDTLDRMLEIFLPKDPLLRSAGVFPVIYWFTRNSDTKNDHHVREFLSDFETKRKANRESAAAVPPKPRIDTELLTFDRLNRSTDDQKSHVERCRILTRRFAEYLI
jgi:hypothetical protein